jgi:hypothetical protein
MPRLSEAEQHGAWRLLLAALPFDTALTPRHKVHKDKYELREPIRNYNNEIGIPLTIVGATSVHDQLCGAGRNTIPLMSRSSE